MAGNGNKGNLRPKPTPANRPKGGFFDMIKLYEFITLACFYLYFNRLGYGNLGFSSQ